MTVRQFIEQLSAFPEDMEVFFDDYAQGCRLPVAAIKTVGRNADGTLNELYDDELSSEERKAVLIGPSPESMLEYQR